MSTRQPLLKLLKLLDVTRLQENDTQLDLEQWLSQLPSLVTPVAAFCVYPAFLTSTRDFIGVVSPSSQLATVVNFPEGTQPLAQIINDIRMAISQGATEIDCVLPYQTLIRGDELSVAQFLKDVRDASTGTCLKIIIESGELSSDHLIARATNLVIASGADFVKTSTGKVTQGVTLAATRTILQQIAQANRVVGFKASGGVKTIEHAQAIVALYEEIIGKEANSSGLRIGASTLLNEICHVLR